MLVPGCDSTILAPVRVAEVDIRKALREESPYLLFYRVQPIDEDLALRGDPLLMQSHHRHSLLTIPRGTRLRLFLLCQPRTPIPARIGRRSPQSMYIVKQIMWKAQLVEIAYRVHTETALHSKMWKANLAYHAAAHSLRRQKNKSLGSCQRLVEALDHGCREAIKKST